MSSEKSQRNEQLSDLTRQKENAEKNNFNAGGNASDYDGGQPADTKTGNPGSLHSDGDGHSRDKGSSSEKEFNAGGGDSDYDGGHPKDVKKNSVGRIHSEDGE
ncbi:hypothetical protein [Planomicrobium sp. YIM 101495]|uniref:hypothetical protein n=1 Tax=Planomicrobium sp. YIM 101495 TaxID=2665160 RepID=UPI0012B74AEA|nr:hypothetical protein [Planomicrobium sp. YIM 101495]MTD31013.1 hypothetical protein [Planomicrobium sp. YIM 101495]